MDRQCEVFEPPALAARPASAPAKGLWGAPPAVAASVPVAAAPAARAAPIVAKKAHTRHLVVDSGAIIKGLHLESQAEYFWTVPEVLKEIRDKRSRHVLETLPYELQTRQPPGAAVAAGAFFCRPASRRRPIPGARSSLSASLPLNPLSLALPVIAFARKTGDYTQLSVPDLKILALTYMLEREQNGIANIRTEPPLLTKEKAARAKAAKAAAKAKAGGALPPGMSKKAAARLARLSRTLAWILRHGAEKVGLTPDEQGFVAVADLLEVDQMKKRKPRVTEENIRSAVRADTEGMFSLLSVKVPTSASDRARTASGEGRELLQAALSGEAAAEAGAGADAGAAATPPAPPTSKPSRGFGTRRAKEGTKKNTYRLMIRATSGHTLVATTSAAEAEAAAAAAAAAAVAALAPAAAATPAPAAAAATASASASASAAAAAPAAAAAATKPAPSAKAKAKAYSSRIFGADGSMGQSLHVESETAVDDGDGDWVNPANFDGVSIGVGIGGSTGSSMFAGSSSVALTTVSSSAGAASGGGSRTHPRVGCVTTDFAMQNVLLQMGLKLVALDGSVITRCKQWLLRCDACFFIVKPDTESGLGGARQRSAAAANRALAKSLFCQKCGSATLSRVAYSTDASGRTKLHLRKDRRIAVRLCFFVFSFFFSLFCK